MSCLSSARLFFKFCAACFILPLLFTVSIFAAEQKKSGAKILLYHSFLGDKNVYSFSFEELARHCDDLKGAGYTFISWKDFTQGKFTGVKNIIVSIDDGHASGYAAYEKVLKPRGIKPLFAVYPAVIGQKKFLSWQQLKQLDSEGCTIAAHGYYHEHCGNKASQAVLNEEIIKSKQVIEKKLGFTIDVFVYPFGSYSKSKTLPVVKQAGYTAALTVRSGTAFASSGFELPRYILTRKMRGSIVAFLDKSGANDRAVLAAKSKAKPNANKAKPAARQTADNNKPQSKKVAAANPVKEQAASNTIYNGKSGQPASNSPSIATVAKLEKKKPAMESKNQIVQTKTAKTPLALNGVSAAKKDSSQALQTERHPQLNLMPPPLMLPPQNLRSVPAEHKADEERQFTHSAENKQTVSIAEESAAVLNSPISPAGNDYTPQSSAHKSVLSLMRKSQSGNLNATKRLRQGLTIKTDKQAEE